MNQEWTSTISLYINNQSNLVSNIESIYTSILYNILYIQYLDKNRGLIISQFSHIAFRGIFPRLRTPWRRAEVHGCWDRVQARSAAAHAEAPPNTQHCPPRRMENQSRMEWGWNMMKHGRRLIVGILAVRILRSMMSEFKIWSFVVYVICSCGHVSRVPSWSVLFHAGSMSIRCCWKLVHLQHCTRHHKTAPLGIQWPHRSRRGCGSSLPVVPKSQRSAQSESHLVHGLGLPKPRSCRQLDEWPDNSKQSHRLRNWTHCQ